METNLVSQITFLLVVAIALVIVLKFNNFGGMKEKIRGWFPKDEDDKAPPKEKKKSEPVEKEKVIMKKCPGKGVTKLVNAPMIRLYVEETGEVKEYPMYGSCSIGRGDNNHIKMNYDEVSQYAFEIGEDDDGFFFNIAGQREVYTEKGERLDSKITKCYPLRIGETIFFAGNMFAFQVTKPELKFENPFARNSDTNRRDVDGQRIIRRMTS